jgi:hypothetical protein
MLARKIINFAIENTEGGFCWKAVDSWFRLRG